MLKLWRRIRWIVNSVSEFSSIKFRANRTVNYLKDEKTWFMKIIVHYNLFYVSTYVWIKLIANSKFVFKNLRIPIFVLSKYLDNSFLLFTSFHYHLSLRLISVIYIYFHTSLVIRNSRNYVFTTYRTSTTAWNTKIRGLISPVLALPKIGRRNHFVFPSCYVLIIPLYLASLCFQSFVKCTSHFTSNQRLFKIGLFLSITDLYVSWKYQKSVKISNDVVYISFYLKL